MSSQLNVDTIVDKAGSGGTNVKVGNTSTYVSDGGSSTQNLVQGLTKQWVSFDGTAATVTADDSFNTASLTDNGTGNFSANFTNAMANANFFSCGDANARRIVNSEGRTTARHNIRVYEDSSSSDRSGSRGAAIGDLA